MLLPQVYQSTNNIEKANDLVETLDKWNILRLEKNGVEEKKVGQDQVEEQPAATLSLFQLIRTLVNPSDAQQSTK